MDGMVYIRCNYALSDDMRNKLLDAAMRQDMLAGELIEQAVTTGRDLELDGDPVLEKFVDIILADNSDYTVDHDVEVNVSRNRVQVVLSMEKQSLSELIDEL